MKNVYIISALRTPLGSFGGSLSGLVATDLGALVIKSLLEKNQLKGTEIDEVFMGHVVQANAGQAPARQAAIKGGVATKTPCTTINKVCASGMKSAMFGAQSIQLGQNDLVIAGGMENMSSIPFYLGKARYGYGYGNSELTDGLVRDGLADAYSGGAMGCFGDATASKYNISREEQDLYAIQSYKRSAEAWEKGLFKDEVIPVELKDKKGNVKVFDQDEEYKNVFFEKIPTLRPVFTKEGTVTAANASTINDGAAGLLLAGEDAVQKYGLKPVARIVAYADAAQDPEWFTTAPVLAAKKALERAGLSLSDIDYFEVNEAFSVVALAFIQQMNLTQNNVNVNGGAVSLGHPLGCSGARILCTLQNILKQNKGKYGLAAICNGGGGASAMIIENLHL
ncbi:MAG: thiolase family protein [Saprospiraceae bacterium]|nr:thiolase family protein [Saprospiraceae bacterium]MBK8548807.1 thiolase family protein [Saprospiraceae bacterium]